MRPIIGTAGRPSSGTRTASLECRFEPDTVALGNVPSNPYVFAMKVTFDSNAYRRVIDPECFKKDPGIEDFRTVNAAILDGRILPFLSETVVTLECVPNVDRGAFFAGGKPKVEIEEVANETSILLSFTIGADNSTHPGVPDPAKRWLDKALASGFLFMRAPRIGQPKPSYLDRPEIYANDEDIKARQDQFSQIGREIEARSVGIAVAKAVGDRIKARLNSDEPWFSVLDKTKDNQEENEMRRSIAEWADGDTVAAHVGYANAVLCTEDQGKSAGISIFDASNRVWLEETYAIEFATLSQLASKMRA